MVIEIIDFNMFEGAFEVIFRSFEVIWGHLRSVYALIWLESNVYVY